MEKYACSIYSQTLHFKTCQLPGEGGCVSLSSLASLLTWSATRAALKSSCMLSREHDDPWPTSTIVNGRSLCILAANNRKIMRPVVNIKCYINNQHVNYLGFMSQHHLHPLLLAVQYGRLPSSPPPFVVNVRVLRQLVQVAIDISFPFLHKKNFTTQRKC